MRWLLKSVDLDIFRPSESFSLSNNWLFDHLYLNQKLLLSLAFFLLFLIGKTLEPIDIFDIW